MLIFPFKHDQELAGESEAREQPAPPAPPCWVSTSRRACKQLTKVLGCPILTQPVFSTRCFHSPQSQNTGKGWASITWKAAQGRGELETFPE